MLDIWKLKLKNILLSFPNLYTIIKIYLTIPIENYTVGKVFFKLHRI